MDAKYIYLLRNIDNGNIFRYAVTQYCRPMDIDKLFSLLRRGGVQSVKKFQVGVKIQKNGLESIIWFSPLYQICTPGVKYDFDKNVILLDNEFNRVLPAKTPIFEKAVSNFSFTR